MHMGHYVAINLHQHILSQTYGKEPKYVELAEFPAMLALAVGKKAVVYGPEEGTHSGEEEMRGYFGVDLGWTSEFLSYILCEIDVC
jgi:hypothetical protein